MTLVRPFRSYLQILPALLAALTLASCGGGGVSAPPSPVVNSPTVTISPANAVLYSGIATTFLLSGGTGPYSVASSNQAVVPVAGGVTGGVLIVVPNPVITETPVTITVRDTGGNPPASATLNVRPGTVTNNVTITPNAIQSASCNPGICSGGDAIVSVTLSQGGIPLGARGVRFDVLSGDFRFITTPPGTAPEQTALTVSVATDETGVARARIRTTALAPNQTALLQITDILTGAFQRTTFGIAQFTGNTPAYFTLPSSVTFNGPFTKQCPSSGSTDVTIFGGSPPYTITGSNSAFVVVPGSVDASGGRFTILLTGTSQCVENFPVAITDATGRTISVSVTTKAGTVDAPPAAVKLTPGTFTLSCSFGTTAVTSSLTVSGGTIPFSASSSHPRVQATVNTRTVTVQRFAGDGATNYPTSVTITVTDGATTDQVVGTVPANCP